MKLQDNTYLKKYIKIRKTLVFSGLFALLLMGGVSSCILFGHDEPDIVTYNLALNFQDASGNDLVKGIGMEMESHYNSNGQTESNIVKPDLYRLKIIASQACEDVIAEKRKRYPYIPDNRLLNMYTYNGYCFLTNGTVLDIDDCPNEKVLTYKFKCLHVFGNIDEREFVTYWEIPKIQRGITYATCKRVEFEGKVYTPIRIDEHNNYEVIIVLEDEDKP